MTLRERLHRAVKRLRRIDKDIAYAKRRRDHFDQEAREWNKRRKAAQKQGRGPNAARAKRKAQRAIRKEAYWDEVVDELSVSREKWNERRKDIKHKLNLRKQAKDEGAAGMQTPARSWNPYRRQVCGWMVPIISRAREDGWRGVVVSGVRTPAYSEQLCRAMCGAPTCPGRCAGRNSNHNATTCDKPQGAIDVSDYYTFAACMRKQGEPIKNRLPIDRVHFSASGQ